MELTLTKSLKLVSDDDNFILQQSYWSEKNQCDLWKDIGYYKDLASVVKRLIRERTLKSKATTLEDLVVELGKMEKELVTMVKGMKSKWGTRG